MGFILSTGACSSTPGKNVAPETTSGNEVRDGSRAEEVCLDGVQLPGGACAPLVPDCLEGHLPTVEGECIPVGPRACPALFEAEGLWDCQAGEKLPCPEGFETHASFCAPLFSDCLPDELPLLGGECRAVGLPEGGAHLPEFDYCPSGFLAAAGGGCAQVGPRACPVLWETGGDENCERQDLLECPAGTKESPDGMYCSHVLDDCPAGSRPLFGGGCQVVASSDGECPPGPFPPAPPDGDGAQIYVLKDSPCVESCGTPEDPYPTITAAVEAAKDGDAILIGAGVYPEGVRIERPLTLAALCPGAVEISGTVLLDPKGEADGEQAVIAVQGTDNVSLSGFTVEKGGTGVFVTGAGELSLTNIRIRDCEGTGIRVEDEAVVAVESVWVHDLVPGPKPGMYGYGLHVRSGAKVSADSFLVDRAQAVAVRVEDAASSLELEGSAVRDTQLLNSGAGGYGVGVWVKEGAEVVMERVLLDGNRAVGVMADTASVVSLFRCVIKGTLGNGTGKMGIGLQSDSSSLVHVEQGSILDNREQGVLATTFGTAVLRQSVVSGTQPGSGGKGGHGLQANKGGDLVLEGALVEGNHAAGIVGGGMGTSVELRGTLVRATKENASLGIGSGIQVGDGAVLTMDRSVLDGNDRAGLVLWGTGGLGQVTNSSIRATVAKENLSREGPSDFGVGVLVEGGAAALLRTTLIEANASSGLGAMDPGTQVEVEDCVIRDTTENGSGDGVGVVAGYGARLALANCAVDLNAVAGVMAFGTGTEVEVHGSRISKTVASSVEYQGAGITLGMGAVGVVTGSLLEGNDVRGITVGSPQTHLRMEDSIVKGTLPDPGFNEAVGVQSTEGATLEVSHCLIEDNYWMGLVVDGEESLAEVADCTIRGTLPAADSEAGVTVAHGATLLMERSLLALNSRAALWVAGVGANASLDSCLVRDVVPATSLNAEGEEYVEGRGLTVQEGAHAYIRRSMFQRCVSEGMLVCGDGSSVVLETSAIDDTQPAPSGVFGGAVQAAGGALVRMVGCLISRSRWGAVTASSPGTVIELDASIVRDTLPTDGLEPFGMGLAVLDGGHILARRTLVGGNATAGVVILNPGSQVTLDRSAVVGTVSGGRASPVEGQQSYGDGVVLENASLLATETVFMDNSRAGIFFSDSSGQLDHCVSHRNGSYGLVLRGSEATVAWETGGNRIWGNGLKLPERGSGTDVTTDPYGLPIPPGPDPTPFTDGAPEIE